jgi:hypothetical protein
MLPDVPFGHSQMYYDLEDDTIVGRQRNPIKEFYQRYEPPVDAAEIVRRLLTRVHDKYVRGLGYVVVTNLSGQPRRDRLGKTTSRGRRVPNLGFLAVITRSGKASHRGSNYMSIRYFEASRVGPFGFRLYGMSRLEILFTTNLAIMFTCSFGLSSGRKRTLRTTGERNLVHIS